MNNILNTLKGDHGQDSARFTIYMGWFHQFIVFTDWDYWEEMLPIYNNETLNEYVKFDHFRPPSIVKVNNTKTNMSGISEIIKTKDTFIFIQKYKFLYGLDKPPTEHFEYFRIYCANYSLDTGVLMSLTHSNGFDLESQYVSTSIKYVITDTKSENQLLPLVITPSIVFGYIVVIIISRYLYNLQTKYKKQ